jgi:hypothetical protein
MLLYSLVSKLINYIITNNIRCIFSNNYLCALVLNILFMCNELQTLKYIFITCSNGEYILHVGNMYISQPIKYIFNPMLKLEDDKLYIYVKQYVPVYCAFDGDSIYCLITKNGFIVIPKMFVNTKFIDNLVVLKINVLSLPLLNHTNVENELTISFKSITKKRYMTIDDEETFLIDIPLYIYIYIDKTIVPVYITVQQRENIDCICETECVSAILHYNGIESIVYYCKNSALNTIIFDCICYIT